MKKIRRSVFETNSSSTHSISISSLEGVLDVITPDENGNIHINGDGEYGWGYETFRGVSSKADYCLIDQYARHPEYLDMLKRVIEQQTGGTVSFNPSPEGYIDHQSVGTSDEAFSSEETLRGFLFNSKSVLIIDNDNH